MNLSDQQHFSNRFAPRIANTKMPTDIHQKPILKVHVSSATFDEQATKLTAVIAHLNDLELTTDPVEADVILMPDDDSRLIAESPVFIAHKTKCIAISDGDILSYYLPALYASNHRVLLSRGRALTAGPYGSLVDVPSGARNTWISPLKDSQVDKRYLYSFMGGSTSMLRKRLFRKFKSMDLSDALVQCTDHYKHWAGDLSESKSAQQKRYIETMMASKFVLCPRGASASSIRMFEAMELGCAPVVLADRWIPVDGVDWSFCIFVKEAQLREIDAIIRSHQAEWMARGKAARQVFDEHFSLETFGSTLKRQLTHLVSQRNDKREQVIRTLYPVYRGAAELKSDLRLGARNTVLAGFRMLGVKFPYDLNR